MRSDRIKRIHRIEVEQKSTRRRRAARNLENSVRSDLVSALLKWFAANARDLPWRRTLDPYAVWVSEIMLQQTQVRAVIPYFERWMRELPTIKTLSDASSEKIHKLWEGLGYYTRVRNMHRAARVMVTEHVGHFPTTHQAVLALPGIGRYTAGAICSIAFNEPAPILDGNVIRVLTRVFGIRGNARERKVNERLWSLSESLVQEAANPQSKALNSGSLAGPCSAFNQSLMELGATICTPRQPKCETCPAAKLCVARAKGIVAQLPNLGVRVASTARRFGACVIERNGALLVRQRPAGVVNGHLWEFPNIELPLRTTTADTRRRLETELGCKLDVCSPLATVKHTITRYRITLEAFQGRLNGRIPRAAAGEWILKSQLDSLSFTSAHRRLLHAALRHGEFAPLPDRQH